MERFSVEWIASKYQPQVGGGAASKNNTGIKNREVVQSRKIYFILCVM
jgi:hypothetical protein